jgi:hypothetical protein
MSTAAVHTSNAAHLIEAVYDLGPTIIAMREEIERERRLPVQLVETCASSASSLFGLHGIWEARNSA